MDTLCSMARYKRKDQVLQFTLLTSWEFILGERWGLEVSSVRVKFVTLDAQQMICPIDTVVDFQRMCHIYRMVNSFVIDFIVDTVEEAVHVPECYSFPS